MFALLNYHSVDRPTRRGLLSLFISFPVPPSAGRNVPSTCSFLYSNMMKPLLKCQYSARYPQLAACHFISSLRYNVASPPGLRPARCHAFNSFPGAATHVHAACVAAPGGNCLISPSFNYLPSSPLGRSEGLRVNERRIDTGQDDQVFLWVSTTHPSRPH